MIGLAVVLGVVRLATGRLVGLARFGRAVVLGRGVVRGVGFGRWGRRGLGVVRGRKVALGL